MSSPALDRFNTWVDAQSGSTAQKNAIKAQGVILVDADRVEQTRGQAGHAIYHLDAAIADPDYPVEDGDLLKAFRPCLVKMEAEGVSLTQAANYLSRLSDIDYRWAKAMGTLFASKTRAAAEATFDQLLAQYDAPSVRTKLTILKEIIASRGL